jgi:hypothetical protein
MAITVDIAVSNSSINANEYVDVTVKVTNTGGSTVNVQGVQMDIAPDPSVIGTPTVSLANVVPIVAGASTYFAVGAVAFAPQPSDAAMIAYTINAIVYLTDGTGTAGTAATLQVSPIGADMPDVGQVRHDSNLNSFYLLLLAI